MDAKEIPSPTLEDRLHDEMIDAIDEEIEMEIDDTRLSGLLADIGEKPENSSRSARLFQGIAAAAEGIDQASGLGRLSEA